jgi:hypothetical protein
MTALNRRQADAYLEALEEVEVLSLVARLRTALERDRRGGSTLPDGYPIRTTPEGPTLAGPEADVRLTPVELAADGRQHPIRDEHHELTVAALEHLARATRHLERLAGLMTGIDRLVGSARVAEVPGCSSCRRAGLFSPTFRGDLCQWCYGFVNDRDANPDRRLPSVALLDRRARGERITNRTISETSRSKRGKRSA